MLVKVEVEPEEERMDGKDKFTLQNLANKSGFG